MKTSLTHALNRIALKHIVMCLVVLTLASGLCCSPASKGPTHYKVIDGAVTFYRGETAIDVSSWKKENIREYAPEGHETDKWVTFVGPDNQYIRVGYKLDRASGAFPLNSVTYFVLAGPRGKKQLPETTLERVLQPKQ